MQKSDVWLDYEVEGDKMAEIAKQFGAHDLQLRALDKYHRVPQATESDDWLIATFLVPSVSHGTLKTSRLSVMMSDQQVVTLHGPENKAMETILERVELRPQLTQSPTGVMAVIADAVTESFTAIIDYVDDAVDRLEDIMVDRSSNRELHKLYHYKKLLVEFRRIVVPTTTLLDALSDDRYTKVDSSFNSYLRDSYSYSWRTHELIDALRDLLTSALDTYLSMSSNRMNDVMKRLTVVTTIFMPISFLAGVGGMNFLQIPFGSDVAFAAMVALMVVSPVLMILYFKKKKWL